MLVPLGLGGVAFSTLAMFSKYQYYFLTASIVLLAYAHFIQFRAKKVSKTQRILLGVATIVNLGVILFVIHQHGLL